MKKLIVLAVITVCGLMAVEPLTEAQSLQVRTAQLRVSQATNVKYALEAQYKQVIDEIAAAETALAEVVESLTPTDCQDCRLQDDLTWLEPEPELEEEVSE